MRLHPIIKKPAQWLHRVWTASIRRQLILGIALVHAVMMTIFVFDLVNRQRDFLQKHTIQQASSLAQTLAANSSSWVLANDLIGLEEVIVSQSHFPDLIYAMILSPQGKVLGHSEQEYLSLFVSDPLSRSLLNKKPLPFLLQSDKQLVEYAAPILANDQAIGWVRVAISQEEKNAGLQIIARDGILYTLFAILVGIVFAWLLAKGLTNALHKLVLVTHQIASGNPKQRAELNRTDELGALATDFNQMLNVIEEKETSLSHAKQELFEESERTKVTLNSIGDGVITVNERGQITFLNPVAEHLTGWTNSEALNRQHEEVFKIIHEENRQPCVSPVALCLQQGEIVKLASNTVLINRYGVEVAIEDSAAPIRDRTGHLIGAIMVFHDISKTRDMQLQMTWQASHDALTGLINRTEFEIRLMDLIESARSKHRQHAMLYIDLDQFKIVNDTCGHVAGDELLKQLALVLEEKLRETDILARLGGDEFGVLLGGCPQEYAEQIAEQLRDAVKKFRFDWENQSFEIGASIGLVMIHHDTGSSSEIMSLADVACYAAKDLGRNRIHVYQPNDQELSRRRGEMKWVSYLNHAIENDKLILYCQRILPLMNNNDSGQHWEILIRMLSESGEIVPPAAFIPAAERYDIMPAIDRWVVDRVFATLSNCQSTFISESSIMAINLSGNTINDDTFLGFVKEKLAQYSIKPECICFEITETSAISKLTKAIHFIKELKSVGIQFALDDFGSGLSSFSYLKNLPVDYLKIDGSFVKDIETDPIDYAMVKSINEIGHVMGIQTIAEFVENDNILARLRALGVNYGQGYGIERPMPLNDMMMMIDKVTNLSTRFQ